MMHCLRRSNRNFQAIQNLQKWQNNQLPTQINSSKKVGDIAKYLSYQNASVSFF
jgi:hypothetical protein